MNVTWIWLVLLFQSNVADVFHCFLFTRHYNHETNREQVSTSQSPPPETPSLPSLTQRVAPHPEFGALSWSLVWHQLKSSPLFPTGGRFRRLLGLPFQFYFQLCKRRAALGCLFFTVVFQGEIAFPVEHPGTYLLSPATQIRTVFVEEISDPELASKGEIPSAFGRDSKPDLSTSSCLPPVLEQYLTGLWYPSPGVPAKSTCARGGLQSQVAIFVRKKVEQDSACQIHNQIFFL